MGEGKGNILNALILAGDSHKYQKIMVLCMFLIWIEFNYLILGPTLIYMDPTFHCSSTGDRVIQ
jgi:hypothetical protein